jgi:D-sedoheptulose 7-phosphate isomerase
LSRPETNAMNAEATELLGSIFKDAAAVHERFAVRQLDRVLEAAIAMADALAAGRQVLAFGNGGSATDAQHLVAELVGRFEGERRSLPGIALTSDSAITTAIANDYGYEHVFARQVEGLGREGDIAFGISTSGRSPNVLAALNLAKSNRLTTVALTGRDGGPIGASADIHINVAEPSTARVQEVHRTVLHAICSVIERRLRR